VYSVVKTSQIKPKIAEAPPNINNLVFDGGIQFDQLADVPIRQPMKKRADVIKKSHEIKFRVLLEARSVRECFRQGMGLGVQAKEPLHRDRI